MTDVTTLFLPGWYDNDVDNDCTAAALVNCARAASWLQTGVDLVTADAAVLTWFLAATNWRGAPSADPGAQPSDVLDYAIAHGIDVGQQVPVVLRAARSVNVADRAGIVASVSETGSAYVTLSLKAGDWGLTKDCGHQVMFGRADDAAVQVGTWGGWRPATWQWLAPRMVGAWRLLFALPAARTIGA